MKRILSISDVHGKYYEFEKLLNKTRYNPEDDKLVILGDIVDRGENVLKTINKCINLQKQGAIILKGNHEEFLQLVLIELLKDKNPQNYSKFLRTWINCYGGDTTYIEILKLSDSDREKLLMWIMNLPIYHIIDDYIFCHAGVKASKKIEDNTSENLLWAKEEFYRCKAYDNKYVIFGHTATMILFPYNRIKDVKYSKIWHDPVYKDKIGIDCSCAYGGRLACLELPSFKEFYV